MLFILFCRFLRAFLKNSLEKVDNKIYAAKKAIEVSTGELKVREDTHSKLINIKEKVNLVNL